MIRGAWGWLAVACALAVAGCKGRRDGDPTKVTVSSTEDATKPIVDEDYRFELGWPGEGWKLLGARDVVRLNPDAVAGAVRNNRLFGMVFVESAPGVDLESYADMLVQQMSATDTQVERRERITYVGKDTVRHVLTSTVDGVRLRYVNHVFLHDGHGYQISGWGSPEHLSPSGDEIGPIFASFKLVPGAVVGRPLGPVITTAEGVGWRVEAGVFESVTGIRIEPPEPWRLMVGEVLARSDAEAEVGIMRTNPDVHIVLTTERAPSPEHRNARVEWMRAAFNGERGAPRKATFAGADLELARITTDEGTKLEYLHGVDVRDRQLTQILASYPVADRERAEQALQAGLDAFAYLRPGDTAALIHALGKRPDTKVQIGSDYALRGGTYRSFANSWRWTKPEGSLWRLEAGEAARSANPGCELRLVEPARRLFGLVIPERTTESADRFHEIIVGRYDGDRSATRTLGDARVTDLHVERDGGPFQYRIATLARDGFGLQMQFWADPTDFQTHGSRIDSAIGGFEIDPNQQVVTRAKGIYRDHRLGFSLPIPGGDYSFADDVAESVKAVSTFPTWRKGRSKFVGVVAGDLGPSDVDEQWMMDFVEQTARDSVGIRSGRATRSDAMLGGHPARRLTWNGFEAYVLLRNGILYVWISAGGAGDPAAFQLID